jgi:CrcB protein
MAALISIGIGAALGAYLRYALGLIFTPIFPSIPLGTLIANLVGGLLIGVFMGLTKNYNISEPLRLAIVTGFLGGLTTFSTFSAETVTLLSHQQYFFAGLIILGHVGGSIICTILGIYLVKLLII